MSRVRSRATLPARIDAGSIPAARNLCSEFAKEWMPDMDLTFDPTSIESYREFLRVKGLPSYRIVGRSAEFPDEYASRLGIAPVIAAPQTYQPHAGLWDYQQAISEMAIQKQKFAAFVECGLGKTFVMTEFVRHGASQLAASGKRSLMVSPLMVIDQTLGEIDRFYGGEMKVEQVPSSGLDKWLAQSGPAIGITNYEALRNEVQPGNLGLLALDESSMLKSHYGKYGQECLRLGAGLDWKLALTGTPAPNDRIEYANHAVFLDHFPNVNAFLAKFFVNRGQTDNRWELKPHALRPFYRSLSHWCIFLTNPAVYGWKDNCESVPPINVHIHNVDLTDAQEELVRGETGQLFATKMGGITSRQKMARIAKGYHDGVSVETLKPQYIKNLVDSWPNESTIIWCLYNDEQKRMEQMLPDAMSISGDTPHAKRMEFINDFKAGRRRTLISKGKVLGFGLNLQIATRHVFSALQDSYELYWQCVKRSNRYGSTVPLNVHIPVTDIEVPMIETVLSKARRVQADTEEQEILFKEFAA